MPSIWSQVQPAPDDPLAAEIAAAGRENVSPWGEPAVLPLPEVDWGLTVDPGEVQDNQQWPSSRLAMRAQRQELYYDLWRGDLRKLLDGRQLTLGSSAALNHFRRVNSLVADLLVRETPTMGNTPEMPDSRLMQLVHDLVTNGVRGGAGYLLVHEGGGLRVPDTRFVWRTSEGGWLIAEPRARVGTSAYRADAITFMEISPTSEVMLSVRPTLMAYDNGDYVVGPVSAMGDIGRAELIPVLALPTLVDGVLGTSWYEDLIGPVVLESVLIAAMSRCILQNLDPLLLLRGDLDRYTTIAGVPPSSAVSNPAGPAGSLREAALAARLRRAGPLVLPNGIETAEYVVWDGQLSDVLALLDKVKSSIRSFTGLPPAMEVESEIPSGMSLRRMFWQLDAKVAPLYHGCYAALEQVAAARGLTLEWENTFEVVAEEPVATEREDVEDEDEARRGEAEGQP